MSRSRTKNNESRYISDADKLLDRAFLGDQLAGVNLRASAPFMSPQQAMGLLQRMGHPAQGDVLATPYARPGWESDRKDLIADFQNRSRQEPFQHLLGYLGELKKVPLDKQSGSAEFSELRRTINGLSKADARTLLPSFNFGPDPGLSPDAFRQLRQGLQDRAGVRVSTKSGVGELKDSGDLGIKGKQASPFPSKDHQVQDAYKNAMVSPPVGAYGEGRTLFGLGTHRNLSSLQVDKDNIAGKTKFGEVGIRVYDGTLSSIDPSKPANANQSFMVGVQAQSNLIHANYTVKSEPKTLTLAGKKVQAKFEGSVDSYIGANGGTRVAFSAGPYPAIQIQSFNFAGARTEVQVVKGKLDVGGRPLGDFRVKVYGSVGGEASSTFSFGRVYDTIEGKVITTGAEVSVTAFAGARSGLEIAGDLAGIGGKVKGEVLKGVGWVGKIYAKSENGVLSFGGEHGAALGVGGAVSWGVSINPCKVVKAINKDLPAKIEAAVSGAPGAVGRKVASGAKLVANAAATRVETAGKALHSAAVDMRDRAINGGRTVGTLAANAWTATGTQAQNFKQTVGKFSPDLSRKIRSQQVSRPSSSTGPSRHMHQIGRGGVRPEF